ncbi:uncharacterized protein [Penaeus vannamei]|uniref:uncharacterized protein n=1 Tax=Penaeus vannamei TaxID=6689 RepID=UPI00387F47A0
MIEFSILNLAMRKDQYAMPSPKAQAQRVIDQITPPGIITYYTDGFVDPINHTAGAGFTTRHTTASIRVTDNASILQAEMFAIMEALTHVSLRAGHVGIHTDSRATIDSLQHSMPPDIYLLTTVLTIAQRILSQGRRIIINWVPSHIGIYGNMLADKLAEKGRGMPPSSMIVNPS